MLLAFITMTDIHSLHARRNTVHCLQLIQLGDLGIPCFGVFFLFWSA